MRLPILCAFFFGFLTHACQSNDPAAAPTTAAPAINRDSVAASAARRPNPWRDAGCDLLTYAELQQLFAFDPHRDTYNARSVPGQGYCLRSWNKPDWKERESANEKGLKAQSPRNTLATQVFDYGTEEMSRLQFESVLKDRRDVYEEPVAGLGDGAVWSTSTNTLLVKKGHLCLQVMLDWIDNPHDNLPKAKEVATVAVQKM